MTIRIPVLSSEKKVCIICEGFEENDYLDKLKKFGKWNDKYEISLINAEGNGNIAARYQEKYSSDTYDVVLVF